MIAAAVSTRVSLLIIGLFVGFTAAAMFGTWLWNERYWRRMENTPRRPDMPKTTRPNSTRRA